MGVGADDDRRGDRSESGNVLQAGGKLFGQLSQLAVIGFERLGLLQYRDGEATAFTPGDDRGLR